MKHSQLAARLGLAPLLSAWDRVWFTPSLGRSITLVRVAVCGVAVLWLLSFMDGLADWFGPDGMLNHRMSARLIEFEETPQWQHWSPLWWTESIVFCQLWLIVGAVLGLLAVLGIGGRWVLAALLFVSIAWIHRETWLQGPLEPALVAMLAYLLIAPGRSLWRKSTATPATSDWRNNFAIRMVQTHWWILIAAGLLMQLGHIVWWRGEAVWWLAATGRSHLLSIDALRDNPLLVNALTHAIILIQLLTLWLVLVPSARRLGMLCALLSAACIGLLADQLLYGMLLAAGALAWMDDSPDRQRTTP